jgi:hypothetical protein
MTDLIARDTAHVASTGIGEDDVGYSVRVLRRFQLGCQREMRTSRNGFYPGFRWWMPKGGLGENICIALFQLALYLDLRVP